MTAKDYLSKARRLQELIDSNSEEIVADADPSGYNDTLIAENEEMRRLKKEIHNKIMEIQDVNQKLVLLYRYENFYTWERIATKMGITFQWAHELHRRALNNFAVIHGFDI